MEPRRHYQKWINTKVDNHFCTSDLFGVGPKVFNFRPEIGHPAYGMALLRASLPTDLNFKLKHFNSAENTVVSIMGLRVTLRYDVSDKTASPEFTTGGLQL